MHEPDGIRSPSDRESQGVATLLSDYLMCGQGDALVIAYDQACAVGATWIEATAHLGDVFVSTLRTDNVGDDQFAGVLSDLIDRMEVPSNKAVVAMCEDSVLRHSHALRQVQQERDVSVVRVMNCLPELFELALQVGPDELAGCNAALLEFFQLSDTFRIDHPDNDTDLAVTFDHDKFDWGSSLGSAVPGQIPVVPAGEVNTYTDSISGVVVVDGALHTNFAVDFDVRMVDRPLTVVIEHGVIMSVSCPDRALEQFINTILAEPNMRRIGEVGFGTNGGIDRFVASDSHINERHRGLHLGLGEHNQPGRLNYWAPFHVDLITSGGLAHAAGSSRRQRLDQIEAVPRSHHPHGLRSEDLDHFPARGAV